MLRLTAFGAGIGAAAGPLILVVAAPLIAIIASLWQSVTPGMEGPYVPVVAWAPVAGSFGVAMIAAGATAGILVALLRPTSVADARSLTVCVGAALVWALTGSMVAALLPVAAPGPPIDPWGRAIGLLALARVVGGVTTAGIWASVHTAVVAETRGRWRRVWAAARRVGAFGVALVALLVAAPLLVVVVGAGVRAAMGQFPREGWPLALTALTGAGLALATSVVGMRWAGVPRRLDPPSRSGIP